MTRRDFLKGGLVAGVTCLVGLKVEEAPRFRTVTQDQVDVESPFTVDLNKVLNAGFETGDYTNWTRG